MKQLLLVMTALALISWPLISWPLSAMAEDAADEGVSVSNDVAAEDIPPAPTAPVPAPVEGLPDYSPKCEMMDSAYLIISASGSAKDIKGDVQTVIDAKRKAVEGFAKEADITITKMTNYSFEIRDNQSCGGGSSEKIPLVSSYGVSFTVHIEPPEKGPDFVSLLFNKGYKARMSYSSRKECKRPKREGK